MIHEKECSHCGKAFTSSRVDAKYCSAICRTQVSRNQPFKASNNKPSTPTNIEKVTEKKDSLALILEELKELKSILVNQKERILTIDQALKMLDISRPTFDRLQAEGLIKVYRFEKEKGGDTKGRGRTGFLLYSDLIHTLKQSQRSGNKSL